MLGPLFLSFQFVNQNKVTMEQITLDPHYLRVYDLLKTVSISPHFPIPGEFVLTRTKEGNLFVQYVAEIRDRNTGQLEMMHSRKEYISTFATDSEIIRTCYLVFKMFVEHEINESFLYKDIPLFNPHTTVDKLIEASNFEESREKRQGYYLTDPANLNKV